MARRAATGASLDVGSLELAWTFETGDAILSSPVVVDGTVYVGSSDGNLYALHLDSGIEAWRFETGGPITASPANLSSTPPWAVTTSTMA